MTEVKVHAETGATLPSPAVADGVLALDGLAVTRSEERELAPYEPRWFRAWEAELYRDVRRRVSRGPWSVSRFGGEPTRGSYRSTQHVIAATCRQAITQAGVQGRGRPRGDRIALLYFDHWGQAAHLENASSWRDAFNLDVIPKFLLREHGIGGFSCRIRGERDALIDGLTVASELLAAHEIDLAIVGGVFRFHPALCFSAAISDALLEQQWLGKRHGQYDTATIEAVGFAVVRRAENSRNTGSGLILGRPRHVRLPGDEEQAASALSRTWRDVAQQRPWVACGGMSPSEGFSRIEARAARLAGSGQLHEMCRQSGDSGCINPLLGLQWMAQRARTNTDELGLMTISGGLGQAWVTDVATHAARLDPPGH